MAGRGNVDIEGAGGGPWACSAARCGRVVAVRARQSADAVQVRQRELVDVVVKVHLFKNRPLRQAV